MAERIERQLMSSTSPSSGDIEKVDTRHSLASNEEPVPVLEPAAHKRGVDSPDTLVEDGIRYVYLSFDTHIPLDEFDTVASSIAPPNLKKYESPLTWSSKHKTIILILCCWCTFTAAYSAGSYSIAANPQRAKWHLGEVAFNTGVTTWALGFAVSPMFLAPFSEINGRRPVFIGSAVLFLVGQIACATTPTFGGMLAARFLVGAGASTFATMVGGVVSDMYDAEDRNTPMALYSGSALAGTGIGPLLSGFIIGRASFRWVYYHQIISLSIMLVVVYLMFKETRGSVLLSRRAKVLNNYLEELENSIPKSEDAGKQPNPPVRLRYRVAADESRSSLGRMLYLSLTIPFKLLTTEPVVFFFSLWVAFAWALLYMTFSVIPLVFISRHNFNVEQCGAVFSAIAIGSILATLLSIYQEKLAKKRWPKLNSSPEGRLYFPCLEGALLPIGLFWFGWTTYSTIPWISPVLAIGCAQMGIFVIYLAVFNYLADVYHRYASSALAAQSFLRNLFAAVFPLFTNQMFTNLDYAPASSLLGGIAALLTLVPWVLLFKGEQIRARSKIASQIMGANGN
jgi:multidrug resistance protein